MLTGLKDLLYGSTENGRIAIIFLKFQSASNDFIQKITGICFVAGSEVDKVQHGDLLMPERSVFPLVTDLNAIKRVLVQAKLKSEMIAGNAKSHPVALDDFCHCYGEGVFTDVFKSFSEILHVKG